MNSEEVAKLHGTELSTVQSRATKISKQLLIAQMIKYVRDVTVQKESRSRCQIQWTFTTPS